MRKVSEDQIGTCQACLGEFKVNDARRVVLHGYQRPGHGYVVGNCRGTGERPFEYDCALTREIIAEHHQQIAADTVRLVRLKAGKIMSLRHDWQDYEPVDGRMQIVEKSENVAPGQRRWKRAFDAEVYRLERDISFFTRLADYLQARVDAWAPAGIVGLDSPATGKLRGLKKAYDPDAAEAEERRAAERVQRQAKPGKLKLTLYWDLPEGEERDIWQPIAKEELQAIKDWAAASFPEGKRRVAAGSHFDLPFALKRREQHDERRERLVVLISLDWRYLEAVPGLLAGVQRLDHTKKKVEYHLDVTGAKPWAD